MKKNERIKAVIESIVVASFALTGFLTTGVALADEQFEHPNPEYGEQIVFQGEAALQQMKQNLLDQQSLQAQGQAVLARELAKHNSSKRKLADRINCDPGKNRVL